MTGRDLKEKIIQQNISALTIAKKLGISPQALNSTFNAADVKSGTLERIAEVLGVKMSFFYPMEERSTIASGNGNVASNNNIVGSVTIGDASVLQERVAMLERLLEDIQAIAGREACIDVGDRLSIGRVIHGRPLPHRSTFRKKRLQPHLVTAETPSLTSTLISTGAKLTKQTGGL